MASWLCSNRGFVPLLAGAALATRDYCRATTPYPTLATDAQKVGFGSDVKVEPLTQRISPRIARACDAIPQ